MLLIGREIFFWFRFLIPTSSEFEMTNVLVWSGIACSPFRWAGVETDAAVEYPEGISDSIKTPNKESDCHGTTR
jgi:hypothetical protein